MCINPRQRLSSIHQCSDYHKDKDNGNHWKSTQHSLLFALSNPIISECSSTLGGMWIMTLFFLLPIGSQFLVNDCFKLDAIPQQLRKCCACFLYNSDCLFMTAALTCHTVVITSALASCTSINTNCLMVQKLYLTTYQSKQPTTKNNQ